MPNSVYPLSGSTYSLKYLITAYKNEKGISFNEVKTPSNQKKHSALDKFLDNTVCISDNHLSELNPIINMLALNIQEKFLENNRSNHYYHKYPIDQSWKHYRYTNEQETFEIIDKQLGCKVVLRHGYYAKCITSSGLKYIINSGYVDRNGQFDVTIDKGNTHCRVRFKTRRSLDFKAKSKGENAGYAGYCKLRGCSFGSRIQH